MTRTLRRAINGIADPTIREALLDIEHAEGIQLDGDDETELREHLVAWFIDCHANHDKRIAGCWECDTPPAGGREG